MPRSNRTFSDRDVVRIARRNLTRVELDAVILELCQPEEKKTEIELLKITKHDLDRARLDIPFGISAIQKIRSVISTLALLPGRQKPFLIAINKFLGSLLTILEFIGTLLG